jgi:hypothetical protein
MSIDFERERLSQKKMLDRFQLDYPLTEMITVYLSDREDHHSYGIYCALIPTDQIKRILSKPTWDLSHGGGIPAAVIYHEQGYERVEYLRYGNDDGIEPLIIDRNFHDIKDGYKEISEEFRLFHQLYHNKKNNQFIKIDENGNEIPVAIIEPNRVRIRLKEIRQFIAIKEMHLSIQFDCRELSKNSLEELKIKEGGTDHHEKNICWSLHYGNFAGLSSYQVFSRLLGKRIITPLPKSKSGFWGFAERKQKKYIEFIIGVDDNGEEITFTSNPDSLSNNFGTNSTAPGYLTPVHFRVQVLDKYFQQPSKYSVEDSILSCGNLWCMQIDNHHENKVCAWLGDLGRDLPYEELMHWRSHNIPPDSGVSRTYFKRQILAQFTESDRPEHIFRQRYHELINTCDALLGWRFLLQLDANDKHHFQCLRVPANDEQRDFDELVLGLTKILIDSLNEKQIKRLIPPKQLGELKGSITLLEAALKACGVEDTENNILFLRKLQNLRSSSTAHRKGSNYRKIASDFGIESQNLRTVFNGILWHSVAVLEFFINAVNSGHLKISEQLY